MRHIRILIGVVVLVIAAGLVLAVDEPASPKPKEPKAAKLVQPWSELTLTEAQQAQIFEIHQKSLAAIRDIKAKERADILALLSDEQKAELAKLEDQAKMDAKAKRAAGKAEGEPVQKD